MVRAGAGDQQAVRGEHLESAQIQLLIAAQCAFDGALGLGEGGRVKNDGVEFLAGVGPVAQDLKSVGFDPIDFGAELIAIGFEVALGDFEGGAGGVDAGDALADIEGTAAWSEKPSPLLCSGVVGALVEEGSGLLAGVGVVLKQKTVDVKLRAGEGFGGVFCPERRWIHSG